MGIGGDRREENTGRRGSGMLGRWRLQMNEVYSHWKVVFFSESNL